MCPRTHSVHPSPTDFSSKHRAKAVPPEPNGFVADVDAPFVQQILHIPQRQWEPDVHHHRQADHLRAGFEVAKWAAFCHPPKLRGCPARLNQFCSDSASLRGSTDLKLTRVKNVPVVGSSNCALSVMLHSFCARNVEIAATIPIVDLQEAVRA